MVEITKESLTFEKPSPLEESIQFKHILNAAKVITQVENITAHCEPTSTIIHGLETTYTHSHNPIESLPQAQRLSIICEPLW